MVNRYQPIPEMLRDDLVRVMRTYLGSIPEKPTKEQNEQFVILRDTYIVIHDMIEKANQSTSIGFEFSHEELGEEA